MSIETELNLNSNKDLIEYLAKKFPNCFIINGEKKPLKIGIFQDLIERLTQENGVSKTKLRSALRTYTMNWRYLHCIKEGRHRVGLNGELCEVVTAEHEAHAQKQLKESKEKFQSQKTAHLKSAKKENTQSVKKVQKRSSNSFSSEKGSKEKPHNPVEIKSLAIGDTVKVVLGSKPVSAVIDNIEKEQVRVKLHSGMILAVNVEHIIITK